VSALVEAHALDALSAGRVGILMQVIEDERAGIHSPTRRHLQVERLHQIAEDVMGVVVT
jgi:hypothetical protein